MSNSYLPNLEEQGTSSEAKEVEIVNKEVEKTLDTSNKWRKRKNTSNSYYDGETCA